MKSIIRTFSALSLLAVVACSSDGDDDNGSGGGSSTAPNSYEFESRFLEADEDGTVPSSVSYSGQTFRHLLISDLNSYIDGLHAQIEMDSDASGVQEALLSFYEFDSDTRGEEEFALTTDLGFDGQSVYNDISSGKNLFEKVAGQDSNDHKDWSTEFVGWSDDSLEGDISNPDALIRAFFATLAKNAEAQANGEHDAPLVYLTASGQDLKQLIQKFLLGAVAFSQGADDYLDEGLETDNTEAKEEGAAYSALEHAWDEGFGYFGAARDYLDQSDIDIADGKQSDADGNSKIDMKTEFNFGASVNAAKRDNGSTSGTDFTSDAMNAFIQGRHLIATEGDLDEIKAEAAKAVTAWENAIAATAIHYINDTLADHDAMGGDEYSFEDHAKHWSELKGFALGLQFNPSSPMSDADFAKFHELIGDAPVLDAASEEDKEAYKAALLEARDLMRDAYGFEADDAENW